MARDHLIKHVGMVKVCRWISGIVSTRLGQPESRKERAKKQIANMFKMYHS